MLAMDHAGHTHAHTLCAQVAQPAHPAQAAHFIHALRRTLKRLYREQAGRMLLRPGLGPCRALRSHARKTGSQCPLVVNRINKFSQFHGPLGSPARPLGRYVALRSSTHDGADPARNEASELPSTSGQAQEGSWAALKSVAKLLGSVAVLFAVAAAGSVRPAMAQTRWGTGVNKGWARLGPNGCRQAVMILPAVVETPDAFILCY